MLDVLEVLLAPPNREFLQFRGEAGRECNLRRTEGEKGGGGSNQALSGLGLGTFFSPARQASSPCPSRLAALGLQPGQRRTSLGSPGAGGGPQDGLEGGLRGGRGAVSAAKELGPARQAPLPSAPQSLFLIRVMGAVPARLPSVCKRLTRGPALNPLGAGLGLLLRARAGVRGV